MGPVLVKTILRRGFHFAKFAKKLAKSAVFEVEKPLENGLRFAKISKKQTNQPFFEGEKSLDMGGVSDLGRHTPSNNN